MTKRTNYTVAQAQALRTLVSDYMFSAFWYAEVRLDREAEIANWDSKIKSLENLRDSALWDVAHANALLDMHREKAEAVARLDEWIINSGCKWSMPKYEKGAVNHPLAVFGKNCADIFKRTGMTDYSDAIIAFYKNYGLECGRQDLEYINYALGGLRPNHNMRQIAKSGQTVWTKGRTKKDLAETLLCVLAEIMIDANAIRPQKIAPELEAHWGRKTKKA